MGGRTVDGRGLGRGCAPSPEKIEFSPENGGYFWCILRWLFTFMQKLVRSMGATHPAPWIRHCYISEMVEDRWIHAARRLTSIEFSFDPCNIYCDSPRRVFYPADARSVGDSHPSCRFTERGLKFNFWSLDPHYALFGNILSCLRWDLLRSIRVLNLKFLASPVPKIWRMCR